MSPEELEAIKAAYAEQLRQWAKGKAEFVSPDDFIGRWLLAFTMWNCHRTPMEIEI